MCTASYAEETSTGTDGVVHVKGSNVVAKMDNPHLTVAARTAELPATDKAKATANIYLPPASPPPAPAPFPPPFLAPPPNSPPPPASNTTPPPPPPADYTELTKLDLEDSLNASSVLTANDGSAIAAAPLSDQDGSLMTSAGTAVQTDKAKHVTVLDGVAEEDGGSGVDGLWRLFDAEEDEVEALEEIRALDEDGRETVLPIVGYEFREIFMRRGPNNTFIVPPEMVDLSDMDNETSPEYDLVWKTLLFRTTHDKYPRVMVAQTEELPRDDDLREATLANAAARDALEQRTSGAAAGGVNAKYNATILLNAAETEEYDLLMHKSLADLIKEQFNDDSSNATSSRRRKLLFDGSYGSHTIGTGGVVGSAARLMRHSTAHNTNRFGGRMHWTEDPAHLRQHLNRLGGGQEEDDGDGEEQVSLMGHRHLLFGPIKKEAKKHVVDPVAKGGKKAAGWVGDRVDDVIDTAGDVRNELTNTFVTVTSKSVAFVDDLKAGGGRGAIGVTRGLFVFLFRFGQGHRGPRLRCARYRD